MAAAHRVLEERRRDRPERREPHVEHRQLARADRAGDERRHARRVLGGVARERVGLLARLTLGRRVQRLHRVGERAVEAVAREHQLEAHRVEVGLAAPPPSRTPRARARAPRARAPARCPRRAATRAPRPPTSPTRRRPAPSETAVRSASACSQHCASAPSAIIGSAVASCSSIAGPIDDERPPRREGPEPAHVVDLAERRAARRVDEAPEQRAERALERRAGARAIRRRGPRPCEARGTCRAPSGPRPGPRSESSPQASSA